MPVLSGLITVGIHWGLCHPQHAQGSSTSQTSTNGPNSSRIQILFALTETDTALPPGIAAIEYSQISTTNGTAKIASPSWKPTPMSRGSITRGGDITVIYRTSAHSHLNLQLEVEAENLRALGDDYSS